MKPLLLAFVALLALASPVFAQTAPEPTLSWDLEFWAAGVVPGVGAPLNGIQNFTVASSLCDMPMAVVPTVTIVNPTQINVADPLFPTTRDCILNSITAAGTLLALPLGAGITGTARARGATLISLRSAASNPFSHAVLVVAPTIPVRVVVRP
jgi:hypothetical protein